jgi:hypothetical protein
VEDVSDRDVFQVDLFRWDRPFFSSGVRSWSIFNDVVDRNVLVNSRHMIVQSYGSLDKTLGESYKWCELTCTING